MLGILFQKWKLDPNDAITKKNIICNKNYTLKLNFLDISRNIEHDIDRQVDGSGTVLVSGFFENAVQRSTLNITPIGYFRNDPTTYPLPLSSVDKTSTT